MTAAPSPLLCRQFIPSFPRKRESYWTMTIDTDNIDVTLDDAILKDGECVGYVTSGGYAHHVQQSMALGYVPAELAADGTELEVKINGEMYSARVVAQPLYDPSGDRMHA